MEPPTTSPGAWLPETLRQGREQQAKAPTFPSREGSQELAQPGTVSLRPTLNQEFQNRKGKAGKQSSSGLGGKDLFGWYLQQRLRILTLETPTRAYKPMPVHGSPLYTGQDCLLLSTLPWFSQRYSPMHYNPTIASSPSIQVMIGVYL